MPIKPTDIQLMKSTKADGGGNVNPNTVAEASLGRFMSTTVLPTGKHSLFLPIDAGMNQNRTSRYQCLFVRNAHATLTAINTRVYLDGGDPAGGALVSLAKDPTGVKTVGSAATQALTAVTAADPGAAITGLAYSSPAVADTGITIGDIPPSSCAAVWVKVTGAQSSPMTETVRIAVACETYD